MFNKMLKMRKIVNIILIRIIWFVSIVGVVTGCDNPPNNDINKFTDPNHISHVKYDEFNFDRVSSVPVYERITRFYQRTIGVLTVSFITSNNVQCFMFPKGSVICTGQQQTNRGCVPYTINVPPINMRNQKTHVTIFNKQKCLSFTPIPHEVILLHVNEKISFNNAICVIMKHENVFNDTSLICENSIHGIHVIGNKSITTW